MVFELCILFNVFEDSLHIRILFTFLADLENEVDTLREEVLRLKGMVTSLDRERDFLQQEVDQKAELLVEAEATKARQVNMKIDSISSLSS